MGFNAAITQLGGKEQHDPDPKYLAYVNSQKPKLTDAGAVVGLAIALEDVAAQTYTKNVSQVSTGDLRQLFAGVAGVEAQHKAILLAVQAVLFAWAVGLGVQSTPVAAAYRTFVRPRLGPPAALEDATPPRFAQGVGLVFALLGLAGFLGGLDALGFVATGFALVAALLNATIGLCLGCEVYLHLPLRIPAPTTATTKGSTT